MNYKTFLDSVPPFSQKMDLIGMNNMLELIVDITSKLNIIHIAGTNGKGSCAMMLSAIYSSTYKTATYTSPYIFDYRECIHINNSIVDENIMNIATSKIKECYLILKESNKQLPTKYECLTLIAYYIMYLEHVDICIIETLMGGLNDATNIIKSPLVCLITSIGIDHTEYLGDTLSKITVQKSGIIKKNSNVILNKNNTTVTNLIKSKCLETTSNFYYSPDYLLAYIPNFINLTTIMASDFIDLDLIGYHQQINLYGVLTCIDLLFNTFPISYTNLLSSLTNINHPCRLEEFMFDNKTFILDGAHNTDGLKALYKFFSKSHTHIDIILGSLIDKDLDALIKYIYPLSNNIILVNPISERTFNCDEFFKSLSSTNKEKTTIAKTFSNSLNYIVSDTILVCGSLYTSIPFKNFLITKGR